MFKTVSLMLDFQWKESRELSEFSSEEAIPKRNLSILEHPPSFSMIGYEFSLSCDLNS